ncbi:unnamed protein product [Rhodiola kirilowii]
MSKDGKIDRKRPKTRFKPALAVTGPPPVTHQAVTGVTAVFFLRRFQTTRYSRYNRYRRCTHGCNGTANLAKFTDYF